MPDSHRPDPTGRPGIPAATAFAALPLEAPSRSVWPELAQRLHRRRRRPHPAWWLAVAALALVVVLPLADRPAIVPVGPAGQSSVDLDPRIAALRAESARLEQSIAHGEGLPFSAPLAALGLDIEDRLRLIDAQLAQPTDDPVEQARLWQQRITLLRDLDHLQQARFELASQGRAFDAALVVAY